MKRGFTLVEILGVIVIIAVLALIITPAIISVIKGSEEDAYDKQVDSLEKSLRQYAATNMYKLPKDGTFIEVSIGCLKKNGLVETDFKNSKTKECFCNNSVLKIQHVETSEEDIYEYDLSGLSSTSCSDTNLTTCEFTSTPVCPY